MQKDFSHSCNASSYTRGHKKRGRLVFTITENKQQLDQVLQNLDETITVCPDLIDTGYYHHQNILVHFVTDTGDLSLSDAVFAGRESQRHRRVIAFQPIKAGSVKVSRYDIYGAEVVSSLMDIQEVAAREKEDWFQDFPMKVFRVQEKTQLCSVSLALAVWHYYLNC